MFRFIGLALLVFVSACASSGPTIIYGPPPEFGPPGDPTNPPQGPFQPNADLRICPGMRVSNAPASYELEGHKWVNPFNPIIIANGIVLASVPVNDVCLSSGFGVRDGRMHEGIDLASRPGGPVYSAAPGRVVEARQASGYGLQVLLDHGHGVFTRYAHLEFIDPYLTVGSDIGFGQPVGMMGRSGNARAVHLHFEILMGDYNNPKRSKGLQVHSPFSFPAWEPENWGPSS